MIMEVILKGNKKSIETLLKKNKRFIEKYEIGVKDNKSAELKKEVVSTDEKTEAAPRKRRTKAEIEADKNK